MPFDRQPYLKGELLELRPLHSQDFPELYAVASDPLIWEQHPCRDRWKEEVFKAFFREAMESGGALGVVDNNDGRLIGSSRFHGYDEQQSQIEIGWTFLARSHWGGRYNRQLKQLMLGHAFRFVKTVIFRVGPRNLRSQRALSRIGAVQAGPRLDSSGRENLIYRIDADQWPRAAEEEEKRSSFVSAPRSPTQPEPSFPHHAAGIDDAANRPSSTVRA